MPHAPFQFPITNRLLLALPPASLARLRPHLEPVPTVHGQIVHRPEQPITHFYFVNRGLISLVKTMHDGRTIEIGAVGVEGVTGLNALFPGAHPAMLENIVQIPGNAWRVAREPLHAQLESDPTLLQRVQGYLQFAISEIIQTAACNRLHSLEQRCCRWLLMAHDSALADTFPLTHEFLAMMLGVQRAGVSIAAKLLHRAHLIDYVRGEVTVTDRPGLEEAACECYAAHRANVGILLAGHTR